MFESIAHFMAIIRLSVNFDWLLAFYLGCTALPNLLSVAGYVGDDSMRQIQTPVAPRSR
jgi:hypothetical protein